jgi:predicted site-specific integrase-resolvase
VVELVGLTQIAERLGVARATVDSWRRRGQLPEPHQMVGIHPLWDWERLNSWLRAKKVAPMESDQ